MKRRNKIPLTPHDVMLRAYRMGIAIETIKSKYSQYDEIKQILFECTSDKHLNIERKAAIQRQGSDPDFQRLTPEKKKHIPLFYAFSHGINLKEIKGKFNLTKTEIYILVRGSGYKNELIEKRKNAKQQELNTIYHAFACNVDSNIISKRFGITNRLLYKIINRSGIKEELYNKRQSAKDKITNSINTLYSAGISIQSIQRRTALSKDSIYKHASKDPNTSEARKNAKLSDPVNVDRNVRNEQIINKYRSGVDAANIMKEYDIKNNYLQSVIGNHADNDLIRKQRKEALKLIELQKDEQKLENQRKENALMYRAYGLNISIGKIAKQYGISNHLVHKNIEKSGITDELNKKRQEAAERKTQRVFDDYMSNLPLEMIAQKNGYTSRGMIQHIIRNSGNQEYLVEQRILNKNKQAPDM